MTGAKKKVLPAAATEVPRNCRRVSVVALFLPRFIKRFLICLSQCQSRGPYAPSATRYLTRGAPLGKANLLAFERDLRYPYAFGKYSLTY